jgi:hypothetical protein
MTNELTIIHRIKKNLNKLKEIKDEDLISQLEKFKSVPVETLVSVFELDENGIDWDLIEDRLREQVEVTHEKGFGIIDNNQLYDISWFSDYQTKNGLQYYWKRFLEKQGESLPPNVIKTVKDDTEAILNRCGAPNRDEVKDIRGLVFGFVQSGKTLNYTSVANASMDTGYDIIIILAGATNVLRKQTQERVNSDVIGWDGNNVIGVGDFEDDLSKRPISLTTVGGDFNNKVADQQLQGVNLSNVSTPVIAVIKKNVTPLKNLNKWLKAQNKFGKIPKSILLIDDESDYASVNTKSTEDPTAINKGLREMLNQFQVSTYLAITATPFANVLINYQNEHEDFGEDLFPRSFIWSLNKPSTYTGVSQIVIDSFKDIYNCQTSISEDERMRVCRDILKKKSDQVFDELPYFFDEALATFFLNALRLRMNRPDQDDVSMMVNISRFTKHHEQIAGFIEAIKDRLIDNIRSLHPKQFTNPILKMIEKNATDLKDELGEKEFWDLILGQLLSVKVIGVHMNSKIEIEFSKDKKLNFILVGGLSLSRGFTIEGLITSVFLRSTRTYDALMQMGRWFGHKQHILSYISLFTTPEIQFRYEIIEEATNDLLAQIDTMRERKETPREFGLGIKYDPLAGLQVVANNKGRQGEKINVSFGMNGRLCETTKLFNRPDIVKRNKELTAAFIKDLISTEFSSSGEKDLHFSGKNKQYAFSKVGTGKVLSFLEKFEIPFKSITEVSQKLPYPFLIDYLKTKTTNIDIVLIQGEEKSLDLTNGISVFPNRRKFEIRSSWIQQNNNQLSKPTDEAMLLTKTKIVKKTSRNELRSIRQEDRKRPLLMIFPLMVHYKDDPGPHENYGWSISTPGKLSDEKGKLVYANRVLLEMLENGDETFFLDEESDEIEN